MLRGRGEWFLMLQDVMQLISECFVHLKYTDVAVNEGERVKIVKEGDEWEE